MRMTLTISILLAFQLSAQQDTIINGDTIGYQLVYGRDISSSKYCDSCIVSEGTIKNNFKHGAWTNYNPDGTIRLIGEYINNRPNGAFQKFFPSGILEETGSFHRGKYGHEVPHIRYYESGCIRSINLYYESGQDHGVQTYFYDNCDSIMGKGIIEYTYRAENGNGIENDTAYRYYENGDLKERIVFEKRGRNKSVEMFDLTSPIEGKKKKNNLPNLFLVVA